MFKIGSNPKRVKYTIQMSLVSRPINIEVSHVRTPFASPLLVTLSPCDSRRCPSNLPEILAFWALVAPVSTPARHTPFTCFSVLQYDGGSKKLKLEGRCQETRTLQGSFKNTIPSDLRITLACLLKYTTQHEIRDLRYGR